jgi:hypothetical protein
MVHDAAKGLLTAGQAYARGDVEGIVSAGLALFNRVTRSKEQRERTRVLKTSPADVIQFSGCKDDQKSADTTEAVISLPPAFLSLRCFGVLWTWTDCRDKRRGR